MGTAEAGGRDVAAGARNLSCGCSPTAGVLIGVVLGAVCGISCFQAGLSGSHLAKVLSFPGRLWLKGLKCMVLPMIVFSMIGSMVMMRNLPGAKKVGVEVVVLYILTTLVAAAEGCLLSAVWLVPALEHVPRPNVSAIASGTKKVPEISVTDTLLNIFDQLVPQNLVKDAANGYLLPVIVASIVVGILIKDKKNDGRESATLEMVNELNDVVIKVVSMLMFITPLGVGSLVFASTSALNLSEIGRAVGIFMGVVCTGLLIHLLLVYGSMLLFARRNPVRYFVNTGPALATALGTSSSLATLPINIQCAINKNGIAPHLAKFSLSLGATINMDGTGLYLICCTAFLGTLEGVKIGIGKYLILAIMATLCSMGAAPVPSASLVLLATIMTSVGVPMTENFGLIAAVDWILDRGRTVVNVSGDATVAAVVDSHFYDKERAEPDSEGEGSTSDRF